ncbi:MAG: hypothetical protein ACYCTI_08255 [Acidimicrobiales bacterium]
MASDYAKVFLTLPSPLLERIKTGVGARGLYRCVAGVLEAEERREALRAWLTAQGAEHGPIPSETMDEVRREWLGPANAAG